MRPFSNRTPAVPTQTDKQQSPVVIIVNICIWKKKEEARGENAEEEKGEYPLQLSTHSGQLLILSNIANDTSGDRFLTIFPLPGHTCSTAMQFLMPVYTECKLTQSLNLRRVQTYTKSKLSSIKQALDLHQLASQLGCLSITNKCHWQCDTLRSSHTIRQCLRSYSYAAALPWTLAA